MSLHYNNQVIIVSFLALGSQFKSIDRVNSLMAIASDFKAGVMVSIPGPSLSHICNMLPNE